MNSRAGEFALGRPVAAEHVARGYRTARCLRCGLSVSTCFCGELTGVATQFDIVFYMHHLELGKASNSARFMACALANPAVVLVGHPDLRETPNYNRPLVLFPGASARRLTSADAGRTLLVPDGSWSQARKIHQRLIRKFDAEPVQVAQQQAVSTLRKSPGDGLFSTADALIAALEAVGDDRAAAELRTVLARFVAATFSTRGRRSQHWMPGCSL